MAEPGGLTIADVPKLSDEGLRTVDQRLHRRYAEARENFEDAKEDRTDQLPEMAEAVRRLRS